MPVEVFKEFAKEIREAILATDLASYFKVRGKLEQLKNDNLLNWKNDRHRMVCKAIMMTSCDLSGSCKPFHVAKNICDNVLSKYFVLNLS